MSERTPPGFRPDLHRPVRLAVLPGDGIGPEVTAAALRVLEAAARRYSLAFDCQTLPFGGSACDQQGSPLPASTLEACRRADAVLMGAVGGPRWGGLPPELRPERGLLALRRELGTYANLRPVRLPSSLAHLSPLRPRVAGAGIDLVFVRELTGGLYFGPKRRIAPGPGGTPEDEAAEDVMRYSVGEIRRVARVAFRLASGRSKRLVSVDKENVLVTSRLWRETVSAMAAEWPEVRLSHLYVDNAAMQLVRAPGQFDVVLAENTFGDILTDLGGAVAGSLGLLPSASLGDGPVLYEPVHGSAPDIAGRGVANPAGAILSVAMLLRHTSGREEAARAVEAAVDRVLADGHLPRDLAGAEEAGEGRGRYGKRRVTPTGTEAFGGLVAAVVAAGGPGESRVS